MKMTMKMQKTQRKDHLTIFPSALTPEALALAALVDSLVEDFDLIEEQCHCDYFRCLVYFV